MRHDTREYENVESCTFRKTKEKYGGLSNMCAGYPLEVNGVHIRTSEALYQACRFPHLPEVQEVIIEQKSPMTAKMKSRKHTEKSRSDWKNIRVSVMRYSIAVKLAQNFSKFGRLLESTAEKPIVEESRKDGFWGAKKSEDGSTLEGVNALGRLLMELREKYFSEDRYKLLGVKPLKIKNFKLLGEEITTVDERLSFARDLLRDWREMGLSEEAVGRIGELLAEGGQEITENEESRAGSRESNSHGTMSLF